MSDNGLDPEIANLLGIKEEVKEPPSFDSLFNKAKAEEQVPVKKQFTKISHVLGSPNKVLFDKDFYNKVLSGEGDEAKRFHDIFTQFLKATIPEDRSLYRGRLIPAYWDMLTQIAMRIHTNLPMQKLLLLRFGIVSPTFISNDQRNLLSKVIFENNTNEPVHYCDEWLLKIAKGTVQPSATDEVQKIKKDAAQKTFDKLEKRKGQRDAEISALRNKVLQLEEMEKELVYKVNELVKHDIRDDLGGIKACFNPSQKKIFLDINNIIRRLGIIDRDMTRSYNAIDNLGEQVESLSKSTSNIDEEMLVDQQTIVTEFNALRQMSKLCVGRKGNHFPVLMKNYFVANVNQLGIRENVINIIARVEEIDSGLFIRRYREQDNRIVPNIILLPNYGEYGICWQPFEKFNRATSRGRIALPIFSKNLSNALVSALGDLRWQVAKERAQHRWMEEGITGRYYQWFSENKLKGDVKDAFIKDYVLWITKESNGIQKLDREIRGLFWRMMPFPDSIKKNLKNRGFVYHELCKKDVNISMSDGY